MQEKVSTKETAQKNVESAKEILEDLKSKVESPKDVAKIGQEEIAKLNGKIQKWEADIAAAETKLTQLPAAEGEDALVQEISGILAELVSVKNSAEDSIAGISQNSETINSDPKVEQLQKLVSSQDFEKQFLETQTKNETAQRDAVLGELKKNVDSKLKPLIEAQALQTLGVSNIDEGRKMGKKWGEALKAVQQVPIEISGVETMVDMQTATNLVEDQLKDQGFLQKLSEAEEQLVNSTNSKKEILGKLRLEIQQPTPALMEALDTWGVSPDVKGDFGSDGKGFNAGVIHYFQYRASAEKNSRYKQSETMDVEGFAEYSKKIKTFLENPNPASNTEVEGARVLEDENGQRRLLIVTKDKELIVAFQRAGEAMKIISVFPGQGLDKLNKSAEEELNPDPNAKKRLNQLSYPAKELAIEGIESGSNKTTEANLTSIKNATETGGEVSEMGKSIEEASAKVAETIELEADIKSLITNKELNAESVDVLETELKDLQKEQAAVREKREAGFATEAQRIEREIENKASSLRAAQAEYKSWVEGGFVPRAKGLFARLQENGAEINKLVDSPEKEKMLEVNRKAMKRIEAYSSMLGV